MVCESLEKQKAVPAYEKPQVLASYEEADMIEQLSEVYAGWDHSHTWNNSC